MTRIMVFRPGRWLRLTAIPLAGLALAFTAFAAQITPPGAGSPRVVNVPARVLRGYAGSYDFFDGRAVMTVKVDGRHLVTRLTGQGPVGIYPESETAFFAKLVKARITFVENADGETTALVLHQNGHTITAPRIDSATAAHIRSVLEARYDSQTPSPGSEAALRHLIDGLCSGHPDYAAMTPQLAQATREQLAHLHAGLARAGAIESIRFLGVTRAGVDVYDVKQEHGMTHWHIVLNADGKVSGAFVQPGP